MLERAYDDVVSEARHPIHGGPLTCANGHPLNYPNVLVDWQMCACAGDERGHATWRCLTCHDIQPHRPIPDPKWRQT